MKIRQILIILLTTLFLVAPVFAQTTSNPTTTATECNDSIDNDKDGGIDQKGLVANGVSYPADKECLDSRAICENGSTTCPGSSSGTGSGITATSSNFSLNIKINNPLKVSTIGGAINLFLNAILKIAIPLIVVFFIWAGLSLVLARGNPTKIETAKRMLWYTVIGTLLILGAWVITNAIIGTVNSITG